MDTVNFPLLEGFFGAKPPPTPLLASKGETDNQKTLEHQGKTWARRRNLRIYLYFKRIIYFAVPEIGASHPHPNLFDLALQGPLCYINNDKELVQGWCSLCDLRLIGMWT